MPNVRSKDSTTLTVSISREMYYALKEESKRTGKPVSEIVRLAVETLHKAEAVANQPKKEK